jgi:hypothetical protein
LNLPVATVTYVHGYFAPALTASIFRVKGFKMSPLEQHLADTAANLNARFCELKELREQVRKALKSPQPKRWNELGTTSRSLQKMIANRSASIIGGPSKARIFYGGSRRCYGAGDDGVDLCFRIGRAASHVADLREATKPTRRALASTRALPQDKLLGRSSFHTAP